MRSRFEVAQENIGDRCGEGRFSFAWPTIDQGFDWRVGWGWSRSDLCQNAHEYTRGAGLRFKNSHRVSKSFRIVAPRKNSSMQRRRFSCQQIVELSVLIAPKPYHVTILGEGVFKWARKQLRVYFGLVFGRITKLTRNQLNIDCLFISYL